MSDELGAILDSIAIFGGLSAEQQQKLLGIMEERSFKDGEQIFRKDDVASNIYVILEGRVSLDFEQENHPLSDIEIEPGYSFGETSLIGVQPHSASTFAVGDTKTLVLSGTNLLGLYETDIKLFSTLIMNIAREASRRLHATDELFLEYSQQNDLRKLPSWGL